MPEKRHSFQLENCIDDIRAQYELQMSTLHEETIQRLAEQFNAWPDTIRLIVMEGQK